MKLHRFIGDYNFIRKTIYIDDPNLAKQLRKVLRLNIGSEIILSDGAESEALCEITNDHVIKLIG